MREFTLLLSKDIFVIIDEKPLDSTCASLQGKFHCFLNEAGFDLAGPDS